ncbi:BA75_01849T0 [Komagataella pastoris]|uniref:BA75_01849T0 n=1 Tax=Komagataella pastoris TaxID=4922 RepID=A0A1B2J8D4_PICPA|nr:BA75_01849T0 [Komagataella pastoris]
MATKVNSFQFPPMKLLRGILCLFLLSLVEFGTCKVVVKQNSLDAELLNSTIGFLKMSKLEYPVAACEDLKLQNMVRCRDALEGYPHLSLLYNFGSFIINQQKESKSLDGFEDLPLQKDLENWRSLFDGALNEIKITLIDVSTNFNKMTDINNSLLESYQAVMFKSLQKMITSVQMKNRNVLKYLYRFNNVITDIDYFKDRVGNSTQETLEKLYQMENIPDTGGVTKATKYLNRFKIDVYQQINDLLLYLREINANLVSLSITLNSNIERSLLLLNQESIYHEDIAQFEGFLTNFTNLMESSLEEMEKLEQSTVEVKDSFGLLSQLSLTANTYSYLNLSDYLNHLFVILMNKFMKILVLFSAWVATYVANKGSLMDRMQSAHIGAISFALGVWIVGRCFK